MKDWLLQKFFEFRLWWRYKHHTCPACGTGWFYEGDLGECPHCHQDPGDVWPG